MTAQSGNTLQHVEQLLHEGKKQEALPLLAGYLRQYPNSAQGWWLLGFAVPNVKRQIECVEHVLQIDPNNKPAHTRLEKLNGGSSTIQKSIPPFVDTISSKPADVSDQLPIQNPRSSVSRKPALHKKTNSQYLRYAVLAVMSCVAIGIFGFTAVVIVRGYSGIPMRSIESAPLTQISLPPTWTPPPTATLIATQTPFWEITPLGLPVSDALPTKPIPRSQVGPYIGYYAPDFSLTNVNSNEQVSLSSYEGQVVIIYFWATWCQYCKEDTTLLQMIYHSYQNEGLIVLAVDVGESADLARYYGNANSLTFPILDDSDGNVSSKYELTAFPIFFFVDRSGVISSTNLGVMDYWKFNKKVRTMLNLTP